MNITTLEKATSLMEALPYVQQFAGKTIVVKYGGAAMTDPAVRTNVLSDVVFIRSAGMCPVLVHGGSPFVSKRIEALGKQSRFVGGFRVTDEETMRIAEEEFLKINHEIVTEIQNLGGKAATLSGKEDRAIEVEKHPPIDGEDIGFVGDIVRIDTATIEHMLAQGTIPVIPPIGIGPGGHTYNINADQVAAEVSITTHAFKLVFLTDVGGVLKDVKDPSSLIPHIRASDIPALVESGVISGGMLPKVNACVRALEGGVDKTHIIDARIPHGLLLELCTDRGIGTEIVKK